LLSFIIIKCNLTKTRNPYHSPPYSKTSRLASTNNRQEWYVSMKNAKITPFSVCSVRMNHAKACIGIQTKQIN